MRNTTLFFRLSATAAIASLILGPAGITTAFAQVPPSDTAPLLPATTADPPARVANLQSMVGSVSLENAGSDQWTAGVINTPLVAGDSLWTQPDASADLALGVSRFTLDGSTLFTIDRIDEQTLAADVGQGKLFVHLRDLQSGQNVLLRTPRGTVSLASNGEYMVAAGDSADPTVVTVVSGLAQVSGPGLALSVGPGQSAILAGTDPFVGSVGPLQPDRFLAAQLAREQMAAPPLAVAVPPTVLQMTGSEPLLEMGTWADVPDYGAVWYPPVGPGWVPYREGHWAWIVPWGWTWVDDAPWGFAPFHYGRWFEHHGRWGWVPGMYAGPPVYAPALVSWVGLGALAVGVTIGAAVGWIPLGPREPYRPWYHASHDYFDRMNNPRFFPASHEGPFLNRGFGSYGNERNIAGPFRPGQRWQPMNPRMAAAARPIAEVPVQPTRATPGISPALAQRMRLPPAPAGTPQPRTAPGPTEFARPARGALPALRPAGAALRGTASPAVRPGGFAAPQARPLPHGRAQPPRGNLPPLAQPNAGRPAAGAVPFRGGPGQPPAIRQTPQARPMPQGQISAPRNNLPPLAQPNAGRPAAGAVPFRGGPGQQPTIRQAPQARPTPGVQTPRQMPQVQTPRVAPQPRIVTPRPAPQPRFEAPGFTPPQVQAPRPAPQPRIVTPRPAPQPQAPRFTPPVQAPRPAPQPRFEAPRFTPQVQAPRPAPQPHFQAPRPEPQPRPAPRACPPGQRC